MIDDLSRGKLSYPTKELDKLVSSILHLVYCLTTTPNYREMLFFKNYISPISIVGVLREMINIEFESGYSELFKTCSACKAQRINSIVSKIKKTCTNISLNNFCKNITKNMKSPTTTLSLVKHNIKRGRDLPQQQNTLPQNNNSDLPSLEEFRLKNLISKKRFIAGYRLNTTRNEGELEETFKVIKWYEETRLLHLFDKNLDGVKKYMSDIGITNLKLTKDECFLKIREYHSQNTYYIDLHNAVDDGMLDNYLEDKGDSDYVSADEFI